MQEYKKSSFAAREGDVFVVTFRKCGTTWMQQIVKLIRNRGREDGVDVDGAFPWLELMSPEEADVRSALNSLSRAYPTNTMFRKRMQSVLHDECACSCNACMEGKGREGYDYLSELAHRYKCDKCTKYCLKSSYCHYTCKRMHARTRFHSPELC